MRDILDSLNFLNSVKKLSLTPSLGVLSFVVGTVGLSYTLYCFNQNTKIQKEKQSINLTKAIMASLPELKKRWEMGDREGNLLKGQLNCPKEIEAPNVDDLYLRCNPNYLQCFFSGNAGKVPPYFEVEIDHTTYRVRARPIFPEISSRNDGVKRFYTIVNRDNSDGPMVPHYGVQLELFVEGYSWWSLRVVLEKSCHQVYLPQDRYGYSSFGTATETTVGATVDATSEDWTWQNKKRHFFIDRFLVTERDIWEWKNYGKAPSSLKIIDDPSLWPRPATHLTVSEMEQYCAFMGKERMEALIYDAASFYPMTTQQEENSDFRTESESESTNEEDKEGNEVGEDLSAIIRSPYPWARNPQDSFLYPYHFQQKLVERLEMTESYCRFVYSKDCREQQIPLIWMNGQSISWIGMSQILGGVMESLRNSLYPKENLKASSYYFPYSSLWHILGKRAYWDGTGQTKEHFLFGVSAPLDDDEGKWKVGFRCMQEIEDIDAN